MIKTCSTLCAIVLSIVACTQIENIDSFILPSDDLKIQIDIEESRTRGTMVNSEEEMSSIGLYCAHTIDEPWSTSTIFGKMENTRVDYDRATNDWIYYDETPTWDYTSITDKYTFMAYSPYGGDGNGIDSTIKNGDLVISYTVPESYAKQPDLMMATPRKDIYPQIERAVSLNFHHALASIGFSVKGIASNVIERVTINNVVSSGEVTITDDGEFQWSLESKSKLSFKAGVESDVEPGIYTSTPLTLDNGYLMMIPQECDDIEVEIVIHDTELDSYATKIISLDGESSWKAGVVYNYTINTSSYDYTIEGTSNCYMLHPNGEEQTYYIPVEGRINCFWRDYADDNQTYKDMLSSSDVWETSILWSDVDGNISNFKAERVTSGFTPSENVTPFCEPDFTTIGCRSAMKITLPSDITGGNILIAVKFEDKILWSWHLWITEYNPDIIAANNSAEDNTYIYTTSGVDGEVHRYDKDDLWATLYKDKFIMDRNLGAMGTDYEINRFGVLHYQFGRKDPFLAADYKETFIESKCVSFAESVQNPKTFYTRQSTPFSWNIESLNMTDEYLWFDKKVLNKTGASGKSIFDPSPLGWRVPRYGTFTVLNNSNCEYIESQSKMLYKGEIILPMTGHRSNNTGYVREYGEQGNMRLSTQINSSYAYNMVYDPIIYPNKNNTISDGFCIRCIEE